MTFLRNILTTLVALFLFSILSVFIVFGIVAAASSEEAPEVKENTVLYFPMNGVLEEKAIDDPFVELIENGSKANSLLHIIASLKNAKSDDRVKGIYIEPMFLAGGYGAFQEIRDALIDFKESGKFVYAYGEYISESDYYIVSVADSLFLNPTGSIEFNGLDVNITFLKGMFDKLDIKPEIFRVGEFKGYVEPFMRKDLSEENRLQYTELLNGIYDRYLTNVSATLGVTKDSLADISNQMKVSLPDDAMAYGLIHKIGYEDELKSVIKQRIGIKEDKKLKMMNLNKYHQAIAAEQSRSKNRVAVIVAEGDIVMQGDEGIVGKTFAKEIRKARENDKVKAIVFRINSGGGSLTASEIIWRELMLTKGKKPIIASLSSVAASGGYYIAMPADTIVAQPNTVTGSIGIFGLWFNFSKFLEDKIGITHDVVKTGQYSDIFTATRPLRDAERDIIQRGVNKGYETFTQKAADARNMTLEELKKIAGGRIWTGQKALELGLVDKLGSFSDAVDLAAKAAGIEEEYSVELYPKEKQFIEQVIDKMNGKIRFDFLGEIADPLAKKAIEINKYKGLQARWLGDMEIH